MKPVTGNFAIFSLKVSLKENLPSCVSFVHGNFYSFLFMYSEGAHQEFCGWGTFCVPKESSHTEPELITSAGGFGFTLPWPLMSILLPIQF